MDLLVRLLLSAYVGVALGLTLFLSAITYETGQRGSPRRQKVGLCIVGVLLVIWVIARSRTGT
jgi:hypothetical protein